MTTPTPVDSKLYSKAKNKYSDMKHSAYKSGLIVKEYKKLFKDKYGSSKEPYSGSKSKGNLTRWYNEDWKNQRGDTGYKKQGDIYRPTKKISNKTPSTYKELNKSQITSAMKEKAKYGKVKQFNK